MANNTERIDQYLLGQMTAEEQAAFESELANSPALHQEMQTQQHLLSAIESAGVKAAFKSAMQKRIIRQRIITVAAAVLLAVAGYLLFTIFRHPNLPEGEGTSIDATSIPSAEGFSIDTRRDTIIETRNGVWFAIPAHAFHSDADRVEVKVAAALNAAEIIRLGLSTTSNGALLQTAGMFTINGYDNGKALSMDKEIIVNVPADTINPSMQLFDGVSDSSGAVNWVNPKSIGPQLRTYDIRTLNFYPPGYLPALKALGKNYKDKRYTDSLYYSFSGQFPPVAAPATVDVNEKVGDSSIVLDKASITEDYHNPEIDPSRIRAIWDPKFNNSILATKEFEERLKYMHSICGAVIIDFYVQHLNRPLYEIDQMVADKAVGNKSLRQQFLAFARRKDGGVIIANGLQQKLSTYFQLKTNAYKAAAAKTWARYQDSLNRLQGIANAKHQAAAIREFKRNNQNFKDEFCANLTDAYRQIGVAKSCDDVVQTPEPAPVYYNVAITTPGWKNLDQYVEASTTNRESMTYTDPATGKTANIRYDPISINIEERASFNRVLVYLLPNGLNSFQRVNEANGLFSEKLNALFRYAVVVVAYKGKETFVYQQSSIQPGNYTFRLAPVSQPALSQLLNQYDRNKAVEIKQDIEYELFALQEAARQMALLKELDFRTKICSVIFLCGEGPCFYSQPK